MTVTREMPRYRCHKEVWALKIKSVERDAITLLHFEEPGYAPVQVSGDIGQLPPSAVVRAIDEADLTPVPRA